MSLTTPATMISARSVEARGKYALKKVKCARQRFLPEI